MSDTTIAETLQPWISLVESLAVAAAAIVAIKGIHAWRREHIGRKRIDTAEEILELFHFAKDAISAIRSPGGFSDEGKSRKRDDGEDAATSKRLDDAFVPIERILRHKEEFSKIRTLRYRAVAFWGDSAQAPFDTFDEIIYEITSAAHMLAMYVNRHWEDRDSSIDLQQYHATIYRGHKDDKIAEKSERMLEQAKELCRPVIDDKK